MPNHCARSYSRAASFPKSSGISGPTQATETPALTMELYASLRSERYGSRGALGEIRGVMSGATETAADDQRVGVWTKANKTFFSDEF
jgi:hypothetical protein